MFFVYREIPIDEKNLSKRSHGTAFFINKFLQKRGSAKLFHCDIQIIPFKTVMDSMTDQLDRGIRLINLRRRRTSSLPIRGVSREWAKLFSPCPLCLCGELSLP